MTRFFIIVTGFLSLFITWVSQAANDAHVVLITIDGFPASMFWDEKTPIPRIRQLAAEGTVAEGLRPSNPTVTWPNHTTLVTGVRAATHSVLLNGILHRGEPGLPVRIEERCDHAEIVAVPSLFDVLHEKGLRTAAIDWPCTRNSTALDDNFPDDPDHLQFTTPRLKRELMTTGVLTNETDAAFDRLGGTQQDEIWTKAACLAIQRRKPHFLALHLLNTDGVHHRYGPQSPPSYRALRLADGFVGQVLDSLDAAGIRQNTTVFITADHGFARVTRLLHPNVLLRQAGLLALGTSNQISQARAQAVPEGGIAMVYLTDPQTRELNRRKVLELFSGSEGIAEVIQPERYPALGWPSLDTNPAMADLILAAKVGYAFYGSAVGEESVSTPDPYQTHGTHGYLASNPSMNAAFLVAGRHIKRGVKLGFVENIDVAPTIAHLLNQKLAHTDGKVLKEFLSQ